ELPPLPFLRIAGEGPRAEANNANLQGMLASRGGACELDAARHWAARVVVADWRRSLAGFAVALDAVQRRAVQQQAKGASGRVDDAVGSKKAARRVDRRAGVGQGCDAENERRRGGELSARNALPGDDRKAEGCKHIQSRIGGVADDVGRDQPANEEDSR